MKWLINKRNFDLIWLKWLIEYNVDNDVMDYFLFEKN